MSAYTQRGETSLSLKIQRGREDSEPTALLSVPHHGNYYQSTHTLSPDVPSLPHFFGLNILYGDSMPCKTYELKCINFINTSFSFFFFLFWTQGHRLRQWKKRLLFSPLYSPPSFPLSSLSFFPLLVFDFSSFSSSLLFFFP